MDEIDGDDDDAGEDDDDHDGHDHHEGHDGKMITMMLHNHLLQHQRTSHR